MAEVKANGKGKAARDDAFVKCGDCSCWLDLRDTGRRRVADLPGDYVCGECVRRRAMDASLLQRQCKTTLIICPNPILDQWQEELQRHAEPGALRVFTYGGQSEALSTGGSPRDIVTAATLATYDVVLCTYGTLGAEIHKDADVAESADENQKRLRHAKRYQKVPTPLTRLCFWRVCLDEAQMVQVREPNFSARRYAIPLPLTRSTTPSLSLSSERDGQVRPDGAQADHEVPVVRHGDAHQQGPRGPLRPHGFPGRPPL